MTYHAGEHKTLSAQDCSRGHSDRDIPSPEVATGEVDEADDEEEVMVETNSPGCQHPA